MENEGTYNLLLDKVVWLVAHLIQRLTPLCGDLLESGAGKPRGDVNDCKFVSRVHYGELVTACARAGKTLARNELKVVHMANCVMAKSATATNGSFSGSTSYP